MNSEIEHCQKCSKAFRVQEAGPRAPGGKEPEPINCPHCGHTIERSTSGWWITSKLPESE
jgi:DNA-directed RNA polymerase subunit RPC12/RpoP